VTRSSKASWKVQLSTLMKPRYVFENRNRSWLIHGSPAICQRLPRKKRNALCVGYDHHGQGLLLLQVISFSGVPISDFYTAYDSLKCEQQKCLVHLVRDIDDDLLKNPLDIELKGIAQGIANTSGQSFGFWRQWLLPTSCRRWPTSRRSDFRRAAKRCSRS